MRIGEIAALVGVTPRAVRHYHHLGLLPEPARRANGYRDYSVRDAVLLARIRRLTEVGLGLDEVRDVIADDQGREFIEVLGELDADLARQEAGIRARRERLAELMRRPATAEEPVSPALARLLGSLPVTDSPMAGKDRELLTLFDTSEGSDRLYDALRPLTRSTHVLGLYRRLDELADTPPDDPRIEPLAAELAGVVPDELLAGMTAADEREEPAVATGFRDALLADFPPAQGRVVQLMIETLMRRARERARERRREPARELTQDGESA
ncbi:MerR family transcriptional regulator [Streptomyces sp. NPDC056672]|uniref:MerR family transcriptional regulator n=1 Tax=Streptomyces sp. NPDC056672 TaxID=3345906 RepID=UPI0036B33203